MTVTVIPDAEAIIGTYLREHPDVAALGARVAGGTPRSMATPWVRVTQLDATDVGGIEHLIGCLLQLDCYAGADATRDYTAQAEASLLARTIRAVLKSAQGETLDGAVVTSVRIQGMARIPDATDFEPARERFILTAAIHLHA